MRDAYELKLDWGIEGVKKAMARKDNIVIIDMMSYSSTIVTAISKGFVVEPTGDKTTRTPGYRNSPSVFLKNEPTRVKLTSSNGGRLVNAALDSAGCVVLGSILNAKATADYIGSQNHDTTLIAAGEINDDITKYRTDEEHIRSAENELFALEDYLGAGAIASFSKMKKTLACKEAELRFKDAEHDIHGALKETSGHNWLTENEPATDETTKFVSQLNLYNVVPKLFVVNGIPEIRNAP